MVRMRMARIALMMLEQTIIGNVVAVRWKSKGWWPVAVVTAAGGSMSMSEAFRRKQTNMMFSSSSAAVQCSSSSSSSSSSSFFLWRDHRHDDENSTVSFAHKRTNPFSLNQQCCTTTTTTREFAAWNKKWKQKAPRKKPKRRRNKNSRVDAFGGGATRNRHEQKKKFQRLQKINDMIISSHNEQQQQQQQDEEEEESAGATTTSSSGSSTTSSFVPPAVLLPTGSSYVYVASIAAEAAGIVDPKTELFPSPSSSNNETGGTIDYDGGANKKINDKSSTAFTRPVPRIFRQATFEYFSPAALNYELPGSRTKSHGHGDDDYYNSKNRGGSSNRHSQQQRRASAKTRMTTIPEVAFLGRSNVGKSSLINALMGRDLARISKQPGRTQLVHYFGLVPQSRQKKKKTAWSSSSSSTDNNAYDPNQCVGFFVDLPGYGYAYAPDEKVEDWQHKTQMFLMDRITNGNLRRLFLLLDVRHGGTTFDHSIMTWLEEACIPYTLVYTKADCVDRPTIVKHVNQSCLRYHHLHSQRHQHHHHAAEDGQAYYDNDYDDDDDDADESHDNDELYMSPIIHVTSSKGGGCGLRELLESIEAEFLVSD